jgi:hypothetical protein
MTPAYTRRPRRSRRHADQDQPDKDLSLSTSVIEPTRMAVRLHCFVAASSKERPMRGEMILQGSYLNADDVEVGSVT